MIAVKTYRRLFSLVLSLAVCLIGWAVPVDAAKRALLIGVENYKDSKHDLEGVREDVKIMKEVLLKRGGFNESEIKILVDQQATKENVVKNFKEWLINGTKRGDTALFYFSGHGIQVWDENGDEIQDGKDEALMCHDSNVLKDRVQRTFKGRPGSAYELKDTVNVLLDDEIHELLCQMVGRTVIFFSDSCHAGTVYKALNRQMAQTKNFEQPVFTKGILEDRVTERFAGDAPLKNTNIGSDLMVEGVRMAAFTASEDSQPAQVVPFDKEPRGKHSVFTWYIYHGLNGAADLNKDGRITFEELATYLEKEVKAAGFSQVPQREFQPEAMAAATFETAVPRREERPDDKATIRCFLDAQQGISPAEADRIRSVLSKNIPGLTWTTDKSRMSGLITAERRGSVYVAQVCDSTGAVWEKQEGQNLDQTLVGLQGNLKAYLIQSSVAAFKNYGSNVNFDFSYELKDKAPRPKGDVIAGDGLIFKANVKSPGYLYIFSVDAAGIIHPLYPMPNARPERLQPGRTIDLGADSSFKVQEPFGREMVFAFLLADPSQGINTYWQKDDIGDSRDPGMAEQSRFLDTLRRELFSDGRPKGQWGHQLLLLRSFQR